MTALSDDFKRTAAAAAGTPADGILLDYQQQVLLLTQDINQLQAELLQSLQAMGGDPQDIRADLAQEEQNRQLLLATSDAIKQGQRPALPARDRLQKTLRHHDEKHAHREAEKRHAAELLAAWRELAEREHRREASREDVAAAREAALRAHEKLCREMQDHRDDLKKAKAETAHTAGPRSRFTDHLEVAHAAEIALDMPEAAPEAAPAAKPSLLPPWLRMPTLSPPKSSGGE